MKDYVKKLEKFLENYTKTHSISFLREDPHNFASRCFKLFSVFSLSSGGDIFKEGLRAKTLYTLWNNVLDDVIEYTDKGKENIYESLQALIRFKKGENFSGKTETGPIIYDFLHYFRDFPSSPNKEISEELVYIDLIRVLNGFDYERIIFENNLIGNLSEYMEFGAISGDLRIFLDIDTAIYPNNLDLCTIGNLRKAYKFFSLAARMASDIATFEREFFVEASQNAVILYGQKTGVLPKNVLKYGKKNKKKIFKKFIPPLMDEIKDKGRKYLSKSLEILDKIEEIDTSNLSTAFETIFEEYPWQRSFSPPAK